MAEPERREGEEREKKRRSSSSATVSGGCSSRRVRDGGGAWKSKGEEAAAAAGRDPLVVLGPDLMGTIMELLDARSVARSIVVSVGWYDVASGDCIWGPKYEELLKGKAHIPRLSRVTKLTAYSLSIMDGKRVRIMKEDLCDHIWEFRFKKTAPLYWLNLDPSWKGTGPPMHRYFHPDGSQTADPMDKVWGGHECTYSIVTTYIGEGRIRKHYVRINRWPPMTMSRKEDWSWEMSNHLYCYSSIPDAEKECGTGPLFPVW